MIGFDSADAALRASARPGLTLRVAIEQENFAAALYLSDDDAEIDEHEVVIARRKPDGRWWAGATGGGKGLRADLQHLAIGVGGGSGVGLVDGKFTGTAEVHSEVSGRIIDPAVSRVEVTFATGARQTAKLANGGYLWFQAEAGVPLTRMRQLPDLPDRLQPTLVVAYDAGGNELQRGELGLHRRLPRPRKWTWPFTRRRDRAQAELVSYGRDIRDDRKDR